jgi:hypothetical protein
MTDNEFNRTARAWLEDGPTLISDRALQSALDEVHTTRQRPAWLAGRRLPRMTTPIRLAAVVGAIALAVAGISLFSGGGVGGPPGPTPTPSPTPMVMREGGELAPLEPGTHVTEDFLTRVTFTVPAGWEGRVGGPYVVDLGRARGPRALGFLIFDIVYADPCDYSKGPMAPPPGPTVDDLADALASLPGVSATAPTDITVDGYRGKQVTLTAPPSTLIGCVLSPDGNMRIWASPLGATYGMDPGDRNAVRILDVDGQRLVIDAPQPLTQSVAEKAEVQQVLDSIQLAPGNPASPSPS